MISYTHSRQQRSVARTAAAGLCCAATLVLGACSSGSSGGGSQSAGQLVPTEDGTNAPLTADTGGLQRNAANNASRGLSVNIGGLQRLGADSSAVDSVLKSPALTRLFGQSRAGDPLSEPTGPTTGPIDTGSLGTDLEVGVLNLINATLGIEGGNAQVTQNGNIITIDPDDDQICREELVGMDTTQAELNNCLALVTDLSVTINAQSDDTGLITYQFQNQDVLLIGYSPMQANYEVRLAGLQTFLLRAEELDGGSGGVPSTLQGAIRLSATVTNETENAEAGSFSIAVTEALRIADSSDGTDISLAPSTLLNVESDAGAGTASVSVDVGALSASFADDDGFGSSSISTLAMAGLTARADVSSNGDVLSVSNLGIGNGPLTFSIDSVEALRVTLGTFGFIVDGTGSTVALTGDLDFDLGLNNQMGMLDGADSNFAVAFGFDAPSGTVFSERQNGALQILAGGPFSASTTINDGIENASSSISVNQGECFTADGADGGLLGVVDCGL